MKIKDMFNQMELRSDLLSLLNELIDLYQDELFNYDYQDILSEIESALGTYENKEVDKIVRNFLVKEYYTFEDKQIAIDKLMLLVVEC